VADGVGVAGPVRAGVEGASHQRFEEIQIRSGAVLADDLDPEAVVFGVRDEVLGPRDHFLVGGVDLRLDVAVAGGDDEVDAVDATVQREVDVVFDAAGEARHRCVEIELGHPADGLALAAAGAGAAGLDHVDLGGVERASDVGLLLRGEGHARRLLAVAQRGVEKLYLVDVVEGSGGWVTPEQTVRVQN